MDLWTQLGEGVNGTNGESSISICTLLCVKWIVSEKLLYNTGSCLVLCDDLAGWMWGREGCSCGRGYTCNYDRNQQNIVKDVRREGTYVYLWLIHIDV